MKITASVMAHPLRHKQAEELALQLKRYPFIDVSITWDRGLGEWDTGERAISRGSERGDWHLVVQDDAILTPEFYANIEGAIAAVPERVLISLYVGTVKPIPEDVTLAVAKAQYSSWLRKSALLWGVGILVPSDHIEPMLDFLDDPMFYDTLYDIRLGMFYQRNRLPVYYTMPSLVDHDDSLSSLLGHDIDLPPRKAHRLATGLIGWNSDVVDF